MRRHQFQLPAAAFVSAIQPQDGDVLVNREAVSPASFSVRQLPRVPQLKARSRDEALSLARAFARAHRVNVWFEGDGVLRLLEAYRQHVDRHVADAGSERRP